MSETTKEFLSLLKAIIGLVGAILGTVIAYELVRWFIMRGCT